MDATQATEMMKRFGGGGQRGGGRPSGRPATSGAATSGGNQPTN